MPAPEPTIIEFTVTAVTFPEIDGATNVAWEFNGQPVDTVLRVDLINGSGSEWESGQALSERIRDFIVRYYWPAVNADMDDPSHILNKVFTWNPRDASGNVLKVRDADPVE
jgi:hypothetical protein